MGNRRVYRSSDKAVKEFVIRSATEREKPAKKLMLRLQREKQARTNHRQKERGNDGECSAKTFREWRKVVDKLRSLQVRVSECHAVNYVPRHAEEIC